MIEELGKIVAGIAAIVVAWRAVVGLGRDKRKCEALSAKLDLQSRIPSEWEVELRVVEESTKKELLDDFDPTHRELFELTKSAGWILGIAILSLLGSIAAFILESKVAFWLLAIAILIGLTFNDVLKNEKRLSRKAIRRREQLEKENSE